MSDFDFDWTGEDPAFLVTDLPLSIEGVEANEYHLIVPLQAPFYWDSIIVERWNTLSQTYETLIKEIDYTPGHLFIQATQQTTKALYGSFVLANKNLTCILKLTYQKLGGSWSLDINKINEILSNKVVNPRHTSWEQVAGYPEQFPVIPHVHIDEEDMTSMADVTVAINGLADAVEVLTQSIIDAGGGGPAPEPINPLMFKQFYPAACGDETTPITTGDNKLVFRWGVPFLIDSIYASLTAPQTGGLTFTVDVKVNGASILSTLITIDNNLESSLGSLVQPVISNNVLAVNDEITIEVTQVGNGTATGLKVYFTGYPNVA